MATKNYQVKVTTPPTLAGDSVASYKSYNKGVFLTDLTIAEALNGKSVTLDSALDPNSITVKTIWNLAGESSLSSNAKIIHVAQADITPPQSITNLIVSDNISGGGSPDHPNLMLNGDAPFTDFTDWTFQAVTPTVATFDGETDVASLVRVSGHTFIKQAITVEPNTDYYVEIEAHTNNVANGIALNMRYGDVVSESWNNTTDEAYSFFASTAWQYHAVKWNSGNNTEISFGVRTKNAGGAYLKSLKVKKYY